MHNTPLILANMSHHLKDSRANLGVRAKVSRGECRSRGATEANRPRVFSSRRISVLLTSRQTGLANLVLDIGFALLFAANFVMLISSAYYVQLNLGKSP